VSVIFGLDLGKKRDFAALAVLRARCRNDAGKIVWDLSQIHRWPLGTEYSSILAEIGAASRSTNPRPFFVFDATGVGSNFEELVHEARDRGSLDVQDVEGITITACPSPSSTASRRSATPPR
jgi:hypothetical protein